MANREVEASSYFARIAQANKMARNDVILDYWPLFPFQTQTRIIEYLIINYPKRYKLSVIAHCKLGDILNVCSKRRLLEGLEKIPDMFAVVNEVKRRLQINYDVLSITGLDVFSRQCFGTRTSYVNTASWKQDSMNECFDIVNSSSRVKYLKIKRERRIKLLHFKKKGFILNSNKLYKVSNNRKRITHCKETVIDYDNIICPTMESKTQHSCIYDRNAAMAHLMDKECMFIHRKFYEQKAHEICKVTPKFQ